MVKYYIKAKIIESSFNKNGDQIWKTRQKVYVMNYLKKF